MLRNHGLLRVFCVVAILAIATAPFASSPVGAILAPLPQLFGAVFSAPLGAIAAPDLPFPPAAGLLTSRAPPAA